MAHSCFSFRRHRDDDVYDSIATLNMARKQARLKSCSDVQQYKEKNGAITFESPTGKLTLIPDARIPLTPRQCYTLVQNWKSISGRIVFTAMTMLARLFEKNDNFRSTFSHCDKADDLKLLERHAVQVTQTFNEALRSVGDPDRFFNLLKKHAEFHSKIPNFKPEYFKAIEQPFLYAIKIALDERYTEQMDYMYKLIVKLIVDTLVEECENALETDAFE